MGNACLPSSCFAGLKPAADGGLTCSSNDGTIIKLRAPDGLRNSGNSDTTVGSSVSDSSAESDAEDQGESPRATLDPDVAPELCERRKHDHVTLDPDFASQFFERVTSEGDASNLASATDQPCCSRLESGTQVVNVPMPMLLGVRKMSSSNDINAAKRDGPPLLDSVRYMESPRRTSNDETPKRRDSRRDSQQSDLATRLDSQQSMLPTSLRRFDFGRGLTRCAVCMTYPILNRGCADCRQRICSKCFQTHECALLASVNELASEQARSTPAIDIVAAGQAAQA